MSTAEDTLLYHLRATGCPAPEREYRFDPKRRWRFDFAWPALRVACEVEGGSWVAGRHTRPAGFEADMEKYNTAALGLWLVLRVTPAMVADGRAVSIIERALALPRVIPESDP